MQLALREEPRKSSRPASIALRRRRARGLIVAKEVPGFKGDFVRSATWSGAVGYRKSRNCREMRGGGDHDQHVEDLVVAERGRPWIGASTRVYEGAGGVGGPAQAQQRQRAQAGALGDLRHGDDGEPAKRDVGDRDEPLR